MENTRLNISRSIYLAVKKASSLSLLFLACLVFNSNFVFAQKCTPSAMVDQPKDRTARLTENLKARRFAALEEEINFLLNEVAAARLVDAVLWLELRTSFPGEAAIEPLMQQWRNEYPQSFAAALSSGINYIQLAHTKRGTDFAIDTSSEQFIAMRKEFEKAIVQFNDAIRIKQNSALPIAGLVFIAKNVAGVQQVSSLLAEAEKIDPKNIAARLEAIRAFNPKWGGNPELLESVLNQAQVHGIEPQAQNFLKYSALMEMANYFDISTKEKLKAVEYYRKASSVCESAAPWRKIADAAFVLRDWENRKHASTQVIAYYPTSAADIFNRGWAQEQLGQLEEAIKDYETASQLGNDWAQNNLGWILLEGKHRRQDLNRAKKLFSASAAQGNSKAISNLESVNQAIDKQRTYSWLAPILNFLDRVFELFKSLFGRAVT